MRTEPIAPAGQDQAQTLPIWRRLSEFKEFGVLTGFVILFIFFSVASNNFLSWTNLINVARQISMIAIMAFGMTVVVIAGGIDLSVGAVMAFTGIVATALMKTHHVSVPVSILFAVLAGGVLGWFNGVMTGYFRVPSFISTLAMMSIARGAVMLYTKAIPLYQLPERFTFLGTGYIGAIPVPVILMVAVFVIFLLLLNRTTVGRYAYAIGGNADVARLSGINVRRYLVSIFAISGLCSGLAGVLLAARVASGQPTAGTGYELDVIAAVVLGGTSLAGGKGTLLGTLIGALIMGVLSNGLSLMNVEPFVQMIVSGLVILLAVGISMRRTVGIVK